MLNKKGIKLKYVISILILFVIISTVTIDWLISMNSYKRTLSETHLDNNYNYVQKLATTTKHQFNYMKKNIVAIGKDVRLHSFSQNDLNNWYEASDRHFKMLFITDKDGYVKLISPEIVELSNNLVIKKGIKLDGELIEQALNEDEATISDPGNLMGERLITLVSSPIYDPESGELDGMIAGAIDMESDNVLKCILGNHQYEDFSYVYVVDREGRLIYHPEEDRLEENVSANEVVQKVLNGETGSQRVINSRGIEFFASYSYLDIANWGIVVQTETEIIHKPLKDLFWRIVMLTVPFLAIILIISGFVVSNITKPLNQLAQFSEKALQERDVIKNQDSLEIQSSVYEVRLLYNQVLEHLDMLNEQALLDGLTGIPNRRNFDIVIKRWFDEQIPFSLIMLDIDHFKKVNDTHGHTVGDEVLQFLANKMESVAHKKGLVFRYGGEEFSILMRNKSEDEAYMLAEDLRTLIENTNCPTGEPINISLGVSSRSVEDTSLQQVIERADVALYQSKRTGRNKTTLYEPNVKIPS